MRVQREIRRFTRNGALALACSALLTLSACQKSAEPTVASTAAHDSAEMNWARAALERNPNLEVVATDAQRGVFTVREKATGRMSAVALSDLAAVPVEQLSASMRAALPAAPVEANPPTEESQTADAGAAATEAQADGSTPTSTTANASTSLPAPNYTIERSDSGVKVSGPGISIVSTGKQGPTSAKGEAGQRTVDPFICEGSRMVHLDNRRIFVDGDAITARAGCELHITNSRIVASGTGVVVQDATVHISNSYIEGASGSFEAGVGAKMFVRDTTFSGLTRRDAFAQITEQGGNQWR